MMQIARSGFVIASFVIIAALVFAKVSIDQADSGRISLVSELSELQMGVVSRQLVLLGEEASGEEVMQNLELLPWISQVSVRRQWPEGRYIEVVPEKVMAYWNDDGFINHEGEVLVTDLLVGGDLPSLYGPDGTELEVMARYQELGGMLSRHGLEIRTIRRTARGAWTIETRDRMTIELGKEDLKARMDRFLEVHNAVTAGALSAEEGSQRRISRMDARYINGVAVHFEDEIQLSGALGDARNDINKINESAGVQSL